MAGALIDVTAATLVTAAVMLLPGVALWSALLAWRAVPALLRPAAAVLGTVAVAAPSFVATLALQRSIVTFALLLGVATLLLGTVALLRWRPAPPSAERLRHRIPAALPFAVPGLLLALVALIDAPHVRPDTYWHIGLSRRIADLQELSSSAIAFEAGSPGNANYPLPVWHALVALADQAPRVDAWSAMWFQTVWLAPVAMLAFAGMVASLVGDRRAGVVGCWTFLAVVVLAYGPWFYASRYLSYSGQVAIYLMLPLVVVAAVRASVADRGRRWAQLAVAAAATAAIGVLHGNYVLYPVLFVVGGAMLLLVGGRPAWRPALLAAAVVTITAMASLAAQLPWLTKDDNFLRGPVDPAGEPTAFLRHRDALTGTEESHHVVLGLLAAQPLLALGALAIPAVLFFGRRRPGPWFMAGGALAMVVVARSPHFVDLLDRLGSVTPVTRLDRVYPAAVGAAGLALGVGRLLELAIGRKRALGAAASVGALAAVAALASWLDSLRDTRRDVITPYLEARWVGGLDPEGAPRLAVIGSTVLVLAVVGWLRVREREPIVESEDPDADEPRSPRMRHVLATAAMVAVVVGLAQPTVERLQEAWEPQAYKRTRHDRDYVRVEVFPPSARAAVQALPPRAVVLAGINDTRRISSLAPVHGIDESQLRMIREQPPSRGPEAKRLLDRLVEEWNVDYVAANRYDDEFAPLLDAAAEDPARYQPIEAGMLRMFRVRQVDGDRGS